MLEILTSLSEARDCAPDALVTLGLQSRSPVNPANGLSLDSQIVLDAAGFLHSGSMRLIPSGNERAGYPKAAQDFWGENYEDIHPELYGAVDGASSTTDKSRQNLPVLFESLGVATAALMTAGYHARRVAQEFRNIGDAVPAIIVAEEVLAERSMVDMVEMLAFTTSSHYRREQRREDIAMRLPFVYPVGSLLVRQYRRHTLERSHRLATENAG